MEKRCRVRVSVQDQQRRSHVSFVIVANLLDAHVILGVDEGLRCGVGLGQGHDAGNVLEVVLAVHFDLRSERPKMQSGPDYPNNKNKKGKGSRLPFPSLSEHAPSSPQQGSALRISVQNKITITPPARKTTRRSPGSLDWWRDGN